MSSRKKLLLPRKVIMGVAVVAGSVFLVGGLTVPASNAWVYVPDPQQDGTTVVANQFTYGWSTAPVATDSLSVPAEDEDEYAHALRFGTKSASFIGDIADSRYLPIPGSPISGTGLQTLGRSEWGAYAVLGKKYHFNTAEGKEPIVAPFSATASTTSGDVNTVVLSELKRSDGATSFTFPLYDTNQVKQSGFRDLEQVSKFSSLTEVNLPERIASGYATTYGGNAKLTQQQAALQGDDLVIISEHYKSGALNSRYLLVDELGAGVLTTYAFWYNYYPAANRMYGSSPASQLCSKSMMVEYAYKAMAQYHCGHGSTLLSCAGASAAAANYRDLGYHVCASLGLTT